MVTRHDATWPVVMAVAWTACLAGDAEYGDGSGGGSTASTGTSSGSTLEPTSSIATGADGGGPATGGPTTSGDGGHGGVGGAGGDGGFDAATTSSAGGGGGSPPTGVFVASYAFGGPGPDELLETRFSPDGSIYLGGTFRDEPTFGAEVLGECHGGRRGYLLRLSGALEPQWARCFGASTSEVLGVAFNGQGDAFVVGRFQGSMTVDDETFDVIDWTLFVASLDADGADRWVRIFPSPAPIRVGSITRAEDGLFITGAFRGQLTLGSQTLVSASEYDGFVARLDDADGSPVWALQQVEQQPGTSLTVATAPSVASPLLLAGDFLGALDLVSPSGAHCTLTDADGPGAHDVYVAELDPETGEVVGAAGRFGGAGDDRLAGLDVGGPRAMLALGFDQEVDPDGSGGPLPACEPIDRDAVVLDLDSGTLAATSARCVGGSSEQTVRDVAVSPDGSARIIGGEFLEEATWGSGLVPASLPGETDGFFVFDDGRVDAGVPLIGTSEARNVKCVDVSNAGRHVASGSFSGDVVLPDGTRTTAGSLDTFVVLYEASP